MPAVRPAVSPARVNRCPNACKNYRAVSLRLFATETGLANPAAVLTFRCVETAVSLTLARPLEVTEMRFRFRPRPGTRLKPDVRNADRLAAGVAEGQARQAPRGPGLHRDHRFSTLAVDPAVAPLHQRQQRRQQFRALGGQPIGGALGAG